MTLNVQPGFLWNETIWNPSMISTALWLDAADSSTVTASSSLISEWRDKSGNARHVTAAGSLRPTYVSASLNNRNIINAAGTGSSGNRQRLTNTNAALFRNVSQMSAFTVARKPNTVAGDQTMVTILTSAPNTRFAVNKGAASVLVTPVRRLAADSLATINGTSTHTAYSVIGSTVNFDTTTGEIWVNGTREGLNTSVGTAGLTENNAGDLTLFMDLNGALPDSVTDMGEMILLNRVPLTLERQKIEGYLAHKWGLEANLPNDHPYKTTGPTP
jgi:hypothetical protein